MAYGQSFLPQLKGQKGVLAVLRSTVFTHSNPKKGTAKILRSQPPLGSSTADGNLFDVQADP